MNEIGLGSLHEGSLVCIEEIVPIWWTVGSSGCGHTINFLARLAEPDRAISTMPRTRFATKFPGARASEDHHTL